MQGLFRFLGEIAKVDLPDLVVYDDPSALKKAMETTSAAEHHRINNKIRWAVIERLAIPQSRTLRNAHDYERLEELRQRIWLQEHRKWHLALKNSTLQAFGIPEHLVADHPAPSDLAWRAFLNKAEVEVSSEFEIFIELLEDAPFISHFTTDAIHVLKWPSYYRLSEQGQLFNDEGAAMRFAKDEVYAWKNLIVPKEWIDSPESLTKEHVLKERNAERRRALFEIMGPKRFSEAMGLETINQSVDQFRNLQSLYRTKEKDLVAKDFIQFAEVTCPSTQRHYFLCVPPEIKTAADAVAWTFGYDSDSYSPDVET